MQKLLLIFIYFCCCWFSTVIPAWANLPPLPSYTDEMLLDVSQTLERPYLNRVKEKLSAYPFTIKVVYLPDTKGVNLATYASSLFQEWQLSENSMLLVVALDRRKIGIKIGAELRQKQQQTSTEWSQPVPSKSTAPPTGASPSLTPHLELLPDAIDTVLNLRESPPDAAESPSSAASTAPTNEDLLTSPATRPPKSSHQRTTKHPARTTPHSSPISLANNIEIPWGILIGLLGLAFLGGGGWYGWKRWQQHQAILLKRERYSLSAETTLQALEAHFPDLQAAIKNLRIYQGKTKANLQYLLRELEQLQERGQENLDSYEQALAQLENPHEQEQAIAFFDGLESDLDSVQPLLDQTKTVQDNLRKARQRNQISLKKCLQRYQQLVIQLQEIRTLYHLQLTKLYRHIKSYQDTLQQYQQQNNTDPLGLETEIANWELTIQKSERELKALPHISEQVQQVLKGRLELAQSRLKIAIKPPPQATSLLNEVQQLFKTVVRSIDSGDLPLIDSQLEHLSMRLQALESLL